MIINETPTQEWIQDLTIISWIIIEEENLTKVNLGIENNVQVKIYASFELVATKQLTGATKKFKDIFS
jgi:hypothetical protein